MPVDDLWYLKKPGPEGERIPSRLHGKGKRYRVRWTDDAGRARTLFFAKKADAERHDVNVRADLSRGQYIDAKAGRISFRRYVMQWQANQVHRESTRAQVETHLRRHVLPLFGDRHLASIRPTDVQALVRKLADVLAPATVQVIYRYVSSIFKAAVSDRLIVTSPCVNVRLPKIEPKRIKPLPTEAVHAIIDAMPDRYRALVAVGAAGGLRQGEAFGLEVEHLTFLRRVLHVEQQLIEIQRSEPFLAPPKTATSRRTVPVGRFLVDGVAAHLAAYPARDVEIVDKTGPKPRIRPARLVFTDDAGRPLRRTKFGRIWRPAIKAAIAQAEKAAQEARSDTERERARALVAALRDATYHDLRHYFASLLIAHGSSVREVQERLGHASATETLNTYSHLWPDSDDRSREAVDRELGDDAPGQPDAQAV